MGQTLSALIPLIPFLLVWLAGWFIDKQKARSHVDKVLRGQSRM